MSDQQANAWVVAYCSLHEVVRAHLAGEVNVKYLRRRHADIEADLQKVNPHERP